jgi:DNA-binding response OmpR family regulator
MMPAVPIILFTLRDNKTLEREALSVGVSALVSKAASMKTLVNQAEDLLRPREPDSQSGKFRLSCLRIFSARIASSMA